MHTRVLIANRGEIDGLGVHSRKSRRICKPNRSHISCRPMSALERFAAWMTNHEHRDRRLGHVYRYHPRSDAHSVSLCTLIMADLLERCPLLRSQAARRQVAYGINVGHQWQTTGKRKNLDLAIGIPADPVHGTQDDIVKVDQFFEVLISCEAKSVMTEHGKSQPRVYDELSSSHEIIHQGKQEAIAAGITVVNIAETFVSPTRQKTDELEVSTHNQPRATLRMVEHLRGLPIREQIGQVGFDAYCTFVVECNNQDACTVWPDAPAPQIGDRDHYETFITRIAEFYAERFSTLP